MQQENSGTRFTASDVAVFLKSEFAAWMDRWEAERQRDAPSGGELGDLPLFAISWPAAPRPPADCAPDPLDDDALLLQRKGREHEQRVLESYRATGVEICTVTGQDRDGEATRLAVAARIPIIYQGMLRGEMLSGRPDFLRLDADGQYALVEAKLSHAAKPEHVLQLCIYADLLAAIDGHAPERLELALGNGETQTLRASKYVHYVRRIVQAFLEFQRRFDRQRMPHPGTTTTHGRWSTCAEKLVLDLDHLRGVPFIHSAQIRKLERAGIDTVGLLAVLRTQDRSVTRRTGIASETLERLSSQARLQLLARFAGRTVYEVRPRPEPEERRGLALVPPAAALDVFFDMEGHPLPEGQLEYLFGAVVAEESSFHAWWATGRDRERAAFEGFVDWVHERFQRDPAMHVYHYNVYEPTAIKRLMGTYASRETQVDDLLRNEVFIDLYRVVKQGLVIGGQGYSLKDIEPLYRPARAGTVKSASGAMAAFERWLDAPDGSTIEDSPTLRAIGDYNQVDCESTRDLASWLRTVQQEAGIDYAAPPSRRSEDGEEKVVEQPLIRQETALLVQRLDAMAAESSDPEDKRIATLLGQLLEFHWRESKPAFWRKFDRLGKEDEELFDDPECLVNCERTETPPGRVGHDQTFEYRFDVEQETKLGRGDDCAVLDSEARVLLVSLDLERGLVEVKRRGGPALLPTRISLVRDRIVSAQPLEKSLMRVAAAWPEGDLPTALDDFLHRRAPRITGHRGGPIIPTTGDPLVALVGAVRDLEDSTLCIQGPPGTGKTWSASHVILELLRQGRRVGVTAHGHKAIVNLMRAVQARCRETGFEVPLLKVRKNDEEDCFGPEDFRAIRQNGEARQALERAGQPALLGATAWAFARPEMAGALDVLVVDEAGQMSLANLVAAAPSARNLVLVGDQMQLAQPLQGSHPGLSGQSALEYLLGTHATIPSDFGVFLATTHRMHPDVCRFISDAVYESRLHPDDKAARRRIIPARLPGYRLQRGTGLVWLPVDHRDNTQASEEEVEVVAAVVDELLRARFRDADGRVRPMTADDILVVAPYNMQVRRLQSRLGRLPVAPRTGSVDLFQGLEAPAVIVSMCASSLADVPRGLEFLLSPNRLNVAISRAQCLAVVVGSPALLESRARTLAEMEHLDLYCRLVESATLAPSSG